MQAQDPIVQPLSHITGAPRGTICRVGPQDMSHPEFYMKSIIGTQRLQGPQFSHLTNGKKVCFQGKYQRVSKPSVNPL